MTYSRNRGTRGHPLPRTVRLLRIPPEGCSDPEEDPGEVERVCLPAPTARSTCKVDIDDAAEPAGVDRTQQGSAGEAKALAKAAGGGGWTSRGPDPVSHGDGSASLTRC